jgi:hypothetical protein
MAISLKIFKTQKLPAQNTEDYLTEEIKTKPAPIRGPRGRFVSSKKTESASVKKPSTKPISKSARPEEPSFPTPTVSTFYTKDVRRFYVNKKWYFVIDDIISLAAADSLNQKINLGDPDKLADIRKKIAQEFTYKDNSGEYTVEAAEASDLIEMIPYVRGLYPGPFRRWLNEVANLPAPEIE